MKTKVLPSQKRLLELFAYDKDTGVLTRRRTSRVAGTKDRKGYLTTYVDGSEYKVHRLVWMIVTGCDPGDLTIDHKNRNKDDNRFDNLRIADETQQNLNKPITANVYQQKGRRTFRARVSRGCSVVLDKTFKTIEEAQAAVSSFREGEEFLPV